MVYRYFDPERCNRCYLRKGYLTREEFAAHKEACNAIPRGHRGSRRREERVRRHLEPLFRRSNPRRPRVLVGQYPGGYPIYRRPQRANEVANGGDGGRQCAGPEDVIQTTATIPNQVLDPTGWVAGDNHNQQEDEAQVLGQNGPGDVDQHQANGRSADDEPFFWGEDPVPGRFLEGPLVVDNAICGRGQARHGALGRGGRAGGRASFAEVIRRNARGHGRGSS